MRLSRLSVTHAAPAGRASSAALWLHGFQSDQRGEKVTLFRERMLAAGRAFVSFDFRGHGSTGGSLRDLTCSGLLEDAGAVIGSLRKEYRHLILIGSSMGGWAAAWHAVREPAGIAALVLIAPALRFPATILDRLGPEASTRWEREGTVTFDNGYGPATLSWGLVEDSRRYPPEDLPARLAVPTLILHGKKDDVCDWRESEAFARRAGAARSTLVLLEDGDHRLTDHRVRLADETESFLRRLGV